MRCPVCNHQKTRIIRTRPDPGSQACDRVRLCQSPTCHTLFNSREQALWVIRDSQDSHVPVTKRQAART